MNSNKTYGLIGKEISHSFSPKYFKEKFKKENIRNCDYKLFSLNDIKEFKELLSNHSIQGLNVTIPYKQDIIPFLDKVDTLAKHIQAVNTIQFKNNKLIGYNTDVIGFEKSFKPLLKKYHKKALVFGTGGASKAVVFVLEKLNIPYEFVSRTKTELKYFDIDKNLLEEFQILINTTPLGMFPKTKTCVDIDYNSITDRHLAYDLVYNPLQTLFLVKSEKQGAFIKNGLEMLEIQAEEAWKIWQKKDAIPKE